jgi:hypothetical protein
MGNNEAGSISDSDGGKKFQVSKEPVVRGREEGLTDVQNVHKYQATLGGESTLPPMEPPAYEDLGSLPVNYGSRSLFLVARDPHWLFSYWDVDWTAYPASRMRDGKVLLKVRNADGQEIYSAEIDREARNWYIPVSQANALFYAEIGFINEAGSWELIARSNDANTPSDAVSELVSDHFATVPYHLAFQKVLDLVRSGMTEGEALMEALSRIQNEGRKLMFVLSATPHWNDEQRRILATLLGNSPESIGGMSSVEIDIVLRRQIRERLYSEGSSELLSRLSSAEGSASLFSAFAAFGSWSEVSSWPEAAQQLLWSTLQEGQISRESLSSWLASWGGAAEQEALSSWLSSWGQAAPGAKVSSSWLSSWSGAERSEFWSSFLGSWSSAAGGSEVTSWSSSWSSSWVSSWPGAPQAQEQAFWSSWLSSWAGGVGPSSAFGSREMGASWSAQPFSSWMNAPRDFFMNVNAEVIFYGGTHPQAKVWVDGKPIELNADGTFRYHFKFPDGNYTIPIVAESPDGVERRSATLRFERNTGLRGHVTATPQPDFLSDPIGAPGR